MDSRLISTKRSDTIRWSEESWIRDSFPRKDQIPFGGQGAAIGVARRSEESWIRNSFPPKGQVTFGSKGAEGDAVGAVRKFGEWCAANLSPLLSDKIENVLLEISLEFLQNRTLI
ncbi:hypothetical protein AVEN_10456-1 [Araneus ventricosus]|uniref:Uncharacterized protein n=1 Tax=Araneus ventricosus TaxID=182803 RepID=A0A4Y2N3R6_ARAVE|nr:hypothetical protein AVEN_10456-1 [Araneus ventricosus]